jgi:hypothetical protein
LFPKQFITSPTPQIRIFLKNRGSKDMKKNDPKKWKNPLMGKNSLGYQLPIAPNLQKGMEGGSASSFDK